MILLAFDYPVFPVELDTLTFNSWVLPYGKTIDLRRWIAG